MKRYALLWSVLLIGLSLWGCRKPKEKETILIAGATTMQYYVKHLIDAYTAEKENRDTNIICEDGGTAAALVALKHGAVDVAMLSRPVTFAEDDNYLRDYLVARDGIAVVVNPANPVSDLSMEELKGIFLGKITDWKKVGGKNENIVVVDRNKGSNVKESIESILLEGDAVKSDLKPVASTKEMIAKVSSTPNAVGYVTLRRMDAKVKALKVDGVEMSKLTMLSGRYPLSRSFYLALHLKAAPQAEKFVAFVRGKRGQELLAKDGLLEVY